MRAHQMLFDTLKFANRMKSAGMEPRLAEEQAEAIAEILYDDLNTKLEHLAAKEDLKQFATKEDLKQFATKEDLKQFATKEELKQFATKEDLKQFATREELKTDIAELKTQIAETNITLTTNIAELNTTLTTKIAELSVQIGNHNSQSEKMKAELMKWIFLCAGFLGTILGTLITVMRFIKV